MNTAPHAQRGGTLLGLILGLVIGLGAAVAVALYVSKVPVPFVDRLPQRTADQDAAEAERNKRWNPNAPLSGKAGAGTTAGIPAGAADPSEAEASRPRSRGEASPSGTTGSGSTTAGAGGPSPAAGLPSAGGAASPSTAGSPPTPTATGPRSTDGRNDLTGLFIQAGAYGRPEDAEQQRAKLAMLGFSARISERDQGGRLMYRVRVGPYETREETQGPMDRLMGAGIEVSLVRVERSPTP